MKTWKPTLEVLEGRALLSGIWTPPEYDVPLPNPEDNAVARPPSQPTTVSDLFHNPYKGISLTPGGTNEPFVATSGAQPAPGVAGATWQPGMNIFYNIRAPQGQSAIGIEFTSAGVVDPTNRDTVYLRCVAGTKLPVSIPDGGTVVMGGVKALGSATVDNDEKITIGG